MKRVRNSDINFKLDQKAIKVSDFNIIFYTVDSVNFFIELNQDDVVEVEREATVEDEDIIRSGGTKATDYYLKLDWHNLKNIGDGVLKFRCINNIADDGFYDKQYNRLVERTTEYYIDTVEVDPEDKRNYADLIADVDTKVDEEINRATEAEVILSGAIDTKLSISDFNIYSAITEEKIDNAVGGGFKILTNPSASTKVGLVNKLSKHYDTNIGLGAVIEGDGNIYNDAIIASGELSHAEGLSTKAIGLQSHVEGTYTQAIGGRSHAEGYNTIASGYTSHAEGSHTQASGDYSHAEGYYTTAIGGKSHAEGDNTKAIGERSHAEGYDTTSSGNSSHAEGVGTIAKGFSSHVEGTYTQAIGKYSHAEGYYTKTNNESEHASGQYNVSSKYSDTFGDSGNTLFSVGNGTSNNARHNAFEIRQNGDIYINNKSGNTVNLQYVIDSKQDAGNYVSATTFNAYSSKTDNDINTKLNISDFSNYSAATATVIATKANSDDVYTKTQVDDLIDSVDVTEQLAALIARIVSLESDIANLKNGISAGDY